jgi:hypothetical protein
MGVVYLASSPADDVVALKLLRPELADDMEFRRRFKSEVAPARRVGGVCTAKVRDADVDADRPWVVTDFVAAGICEGQNSELLPADAAKQSPFPAIPGALALDGTKPSYGSYHQELAARKGPVLMLLICSTPTGGPMPAKIAAWAHQQYARL